MTNFTALCAPGWSNVGLFHYPPTDPSKCYTNIMTINVIYVVGAIISIPPIVLGIQAMLELYRKGGNRGLWIYMISTTTYCMHNIGVVSLRLFLTHEEEILGRPQMRPYVFLYVNQEITFWVGAFVFMYKYLEYIKASCKVELFRRKRKNYKLVVFAFVLGICCGVCMICLMAYVGFGNPEGIAKRSLYTAMFLDITAATCGLVVWPSVSIPLARDLKLLLKEAKGHKTDSTAKRVTTALRKLKVLTFLIFSTGEQSIVSIVLALVLSDYARLLPYLMPGKFFVLCPLLLTVGITILMPKGLVRVVPSSITRVSTAKQRSGATKSASG